ncbi:hypothetical protein L226DRAFT_534411 [Lentinus tigrinus ALCF2SS1-7]|uniref:uncharacterized protein n=1 Tax=Lentinus tigrinus ALCF2SS1-7 TaxID=1328758 RepID=UPI001165DDF2|nr:hypothetical protein L226DRAFT_534411 [Lentinus tigrinus ALCF2SS1-7]
MNPWDPTQLHRHLQQGHQPSVVPLQQPPPPAPLHRQLSSAPPQQYLPPAPQRPPPAQQVPLAPHTQRVVYSAPHPIPPTTQSHPPPASMATETPQIPRDVTPLREFAAWVAAAFRDQEMRTTAKIDRLEIAMGKLSQMTAEGLELAKRQETKNAVVPTQQEMKDAFTAMQHFVTQATRAVLGKADKLESMLGDPSSPDYGSKKTVFGRIDSLEQALLELSETVSDPDAARPVIVRHEAAVNTSPPPRTTADVGIAALEPPSPLQLPQPLLQVTETGVQADGPVLVDAEVETTTEVPRRSSTESGTVFTPSPTSSRAAPLFHKSFAVQSLAPAQWTPREDDTESSVSESSCRLTQYPPRDGDLAVPDHIYATTSTVERFASSAFDEQEIDNDLGADDTTQCALSPSALSHRSSTLSPVAMSPIALPRPVTISPIPAPSISTTLPPAVPISPIPLQTPAAPLTPPSLRPINASPATLRENENHASDASPGELARGVLSPGDASSSSLSSVPSSSPLLPPQQTSQPQTAPPRLHTVERTTSYSSMSSLSSLGSDTSNYTESASTAAPAKVKTERSDTGPLGRPAKRRKTVANAGELQDQAGNAHAGSSASTKRGRGGSSSGRGGRGRGRVGGGRKSRQLLITPIKPAPQPVPKKPRKRYEVPRIGTDCPWPAKVNGYDRREFVLCDFCEGWYHFGCVGMTKGDPRLEPDAEFICPPCESSSDICEQRRNVRFDKTACLRPDCDYPGAAEDTNEYSVERIIGRRPYRAEIDIDVFQPTRFMWLVKWDGWKADDATWTGDEHLGECSRIIEEFEQAAEIEGRNLDDHDATVLLNEAAAVGWGAARF